MFVSVVAPGFLRAPDSLCFGFYIDMTVMQFPEKPPLLWHTKLGRGVGICFAFSYKTW